MKERRLKIKFDAARSEVLVAGNEAGLRYLADVRLRIIGKDTPAGHWHLMVGMGNLEEGSVDSVVEYVPEWD